MTPPATGFARGLHHPPRTRSLAAPLRSAGQTAGPMPLRDRVSVLALRPAGAVLRRCAPSPSSTELPPPGPHPRAQTGPVLLGGAGGR
jgi:hypothetical protein